MARVFLGRFGSRTDRRHTTTVGTVATISANRDVALAFDAINLPSANYTVSLAESAAIVESISSTISISATVVDSVTLLDNSIERIDGVVSVFDTDILSDSLLASISAIPIVAEAIAPFNSIITVDDSSVSISDAVIVFDNLSITIDRSPPSLAETVSLSDSGAVGYLAIANMLDVAVVSDSAAFVVTNTASLSEIVPNSDTITVGMNFKGSLVEVSSDILESLGSLWNDSVLVPEAVLLDETILTSRSMRFSGSDFIGMADSLTPFSAEHSLISEGIAVTDSISFSKDQPIYVSESTGVSDTITIHTQIFSAPYMVNSKVEEFLSLIRGDLKTALWNGTAGSHTSLPGLNRVIPESLKDVTRDQYLRGFSVLVQHMDGQEWSDVGLEDAPAFVNGWLNFEGAQAVGFRREGSSSVRLRGTAQGGSFGSVLFTLPDELVPTGVQDFPVSSGPTIGSVRIQTNGQVLMLSGSTSRLSLDGIVYSRS